MPEICLKALELHRAGRFPEASDSYSRCLELQPANFEARSNLGAVLVQQGRYGAAIESYRLALNQAPPQVLQALRRNLALAYYKSGRIPDAVRELAQIHDQNPEDRQTLFLLADSYLLMGEPGKTVALLTSLEHSDEPAVEYLLGTGLIQSGNVERGKSVIDRILKQSESAEAHILLGASMFAAKDYPAAVAEFQRAVTINSELPLAHSYLGQALLATGDADGAAEAFRKELTLNANDFEANAQLGEILAAREDYAGALPLLSRAVSVRPSASDVHVALARVFGVTGDAANATAEREWAQAHGVSAESATKTDGPQIGSIAPAIPAANLSQYRGRSPVLLVFASYSCPQFRAQAQKLNTLYERFGRRVPFVLVYIREAHAGSSWQSSVNRREGIQVLEAKDMKEKQANAELCLRKLRIRFSVAVDDLSGGAETSYAAWPSRVFLIDKRGRIAFQTHLDEQEFHAATLEQQLERSVANQQ